MRHSKSQLRSQLIRSSSTCRLLQRSHVRHRTPQIFRSQFETKVHNRIRKRVENYVENRSSHVRNPVFYEQICDELLSGFYHDSTFRPSRTERIVRARGHPRGRRKTRRLQVPDIAGHTTVSSADRKSLITPQPTHLTTTFGPQPLVHERSPSPASSFRQI